MQFPRLSWWPHLLPFSIDSTPIERRRKFVGRSCWMFAVTGAEPDGWLWHIQPTPEGGLGNFLEESIQGKPDALVDYPANQTRYHLQIPQLLQQPFRRGQLKYGGRRRQTRFPLTWKPPFFEWLPEHSHDHRLSIRPASPNATPARGALPVCRQL